jgi:hypothetical protein
VKKAATFKALVGRLAAGEIVPVDEVKWTAMEDGVTVVDDVDTAMSGRILLVRWPEGDGKGWAIVEDPAPRLKVVRPLKDEAEARALIADRLAAYERMWDG